MLSHTPKPNPSESGAVVKNKHCDTELRVKKQVVWPPLTHHNFNFTKGPHRSQSKSFPWLFQETRQVVVFHKIRFSEANTYFFSPRRSVKPWNGSRFFQYLIKTNSNANAFDINSYLLIKLKFQRWRFPFSLAQCVQVFGWPWRSRLGALPLDPPTAYGHALLELSMTKCYWLEGRSCLSRPRPSAVEIEWHHWHERWQGGWGVGRSDQLIEFQNAPYAVL